MSDAPLARVRETIVEGSFGLSPTEQEDLHLSQTITIRRRASGTGALYEIASQIPDDTQLRDIDSQNVSDLKEAIKDFDLHPDGSNSAVFEDRVEQAWKTFVQLVAP